MRKFWLASGGFFALVLSASVWSYRTSLERRETQIAAVTPGSVTTNPYDLTGFTKEAKLKFYLIGNGDVNLALTSGSNTANLVLPTGGSVETPFTVKPLDTVNVKVTVNGTPLYGWVTNNDPAQRWCDGLLDPAEDAIKAANEVTVSYQCWNDDDSGDDYYDDYNIIVVQPALAASPSPAASASPNPSASPGASPSPVPSPAPSQPDTGTPTSLTLALMLILLMAVYARAF